MSAKLPDGTVVPSYLGIATTIQPEDDGAFSNVLLRLGEVVEIVYPDDNRSLSRKTVEYIVRVQHMDDGVPTTSEYQGCILSNPLGGFADKFFYTLRAAKDGEVDSTGRGKGSKVLLLCVNGEKTKAVIIGGVRDQEDANEEKDKAKKLGHHYGSVFNGLNTTINDDGEYQITFNGKTKIDGTKDSSVQDGAPGSLFKMQKDGGILLQTGDSNESVLLDRANKQVVIKHQKGVLIGQATDNMLLGSTFRKQHQQLHNKTTAAFKAIQTAASAAAAALSSASGQVAGPYMAATAGPFLATASAQLSTIAAQAGNAAAALDSFEGLANQYLSQYNKSD